MRDQEQVNQKLGTYVPASGAAPVPTIAKIVLRQAAPKAKTFPKGAKVAFVTTENETYFGTYEGREYRHRQGSFYLVRIGNRLEPLWYNGLPGRSLTVQK